MVNLNELKLSDLLPESIKNDKEIAVMAEDFDKELQAITACINEIVLLPRIDELPEGIIDMLAWQFHADFYEPLGLSIDKKKALVKNSLNWHRRKGTKSALEEIIRILYSDDFAIEEWFEYGGDPYKFRLRSATPTDISEFEWLLILINTMKNVRSHLDSIITEINHNMSLYIGTVPQSVHIESEVESQNLEAVSIDNRLYTGVTPVHRLSILEMEAENRSLTDVKNSFQAITVPVYGISFFEAYSNDGTIIINSHLDFNTTLETYGYAEIIERV